MFPKKLYHSNLLKPITRVLLTSILLVSISGWLPAQDSALFQENVSAISKQNEWFNLLYMGAMFVLFAYNFLFYFIARDRAYIFYSFFVLTNGAYTFYVWMRLDPTLTESVLSNPDQLNYIALITFFGIVSYTLFVQAFLETKKVLPRWHSILNGLAFISIPLLLLCLFILFNNQLDNRYSTMIMALYICVSSLIGLVLGIPFYKTGDRKAYFFITGLMLLCVGVFLSAFTFAKYGRSGAFLFCFQSGSILEVICFSLGLGYKQLVNEKEKQKVKLALF
ncbi:MAG: 7TM-DISM domain-containing protein, partial [Saprospiraceae bacterium]